VDELGVVDFDEVAFFLVIKSSSCRAVGFIADNEIKVGKPVEVLCLADDIDGMVGGENDAHVLGVVAFLHGGG
jgi:hypothetical protein